jgi:hypothetical protein
VAAREENDWTLLSARYHSTVGAAKGEYMEAPLR